MKFTKTQNKLIIVFGGMFLSAIILISSLNFFSVKKELLNYIKTKQLHSYLEAAQSNTFNMVDKNLSIVKLLATDPAIVDWFSGNDKNGDLKKISINRLASTVKENGYFTGCFVNDATKEYLTKDGKIIDVMTEDDPDDSWYFHFKNSGNTYSFDFDYNKELEKSLIFANVAVQNSSGNFLGVAAIGLDPSDSFKDFEDRRITKNSELFLIDNTGLIKITHNKDKIGKNINEYIENNIFNNIIGINKDSIKDEYSSNKQHIITYMRIGEADLFMVMKSPVNELTALLNPIKNNTYMVGLIMVLIAVFVTIIVSRSITKPLEEVVSFSKEFSNGKFIKTLPDYLFNRKDEIFKLSTSLRNMRLKILEILQKVQKSSEIIINTGGELAQSADVLLEQSNNQTNLTQEISTTTEKMRLNISQNAKNAQQTEKFANELRNKSERGKQIIEQTVTSMNEINNHIGIIKEIANQTNILALNAAVEAARAGEYGKGFAVVAAEVRKLAERSKEASEKITQQSKKGVIVSKEAGVIFGDLLPQINKAHDLVQEISNSSKKQEVGANQIVDSISNLDSTTQTNANTVKNFTEQTEKLFKQSKELKEAVSYFKTT